MTNLRWTSETVQAWDALAEAAEYHAYRDAIGSLGYRSMPTCRDDLDPDRTDLELTDGELPLAGQGFVYLITAEIAGDMEGPLGDATCSERSNFAPCP